MALLVENGGFLFFLKIMIITFEVFGSVAGLDIRLGMLSPFRHPRLAWENNAAAATIAIERAQNAGILSNHNITVIWRDDECSSVGGAGKAVLLRTVDDVDVFIGPPCSAATQPVGQLASFWNFPIFSQASSDPVLEDKTTYKTLIRLGPPFNKLGRAFVEIFKYFNWNRVVMISRRKTDNKRVFCDYSSRSSEEVFRLHNITLADWMQIDDNLSDQQIDDLLIRIRQRGRIVILCTENPSDKRKILLRASRQGMMDGQYVYFTPDHLPPPDIETPWVKPDGDDNEANQAFMHVFQLTVAEMAGTDVELFRDLVAQKMAEPPWNYNYTLASGMRGSEYSPFLHDVVYLYLLVLNETIAEGENHRNGTLLFEKCKGKSFRGITGYVAVDDKGDREPDYWVWDLQPGWTKFRHIMEIQMTNSSSSSQRLHLLESLYWHTLDGKVPLDTPICGFFNENCIHPTKDNLDNIVYPVVGVILTLSVAAIIVIVFIVRKRRQFENELRQQPWIVEYDDISFSKTTGIQGSISLISLGTDLSTQKDRSSSKLSLALNEQVFTCIGYHKGTTVAIRKLEKMETLKRDDHLELKAMRDLTHENVNAFIGICVDDRGPCVLSTYCSKGSLLDIIENDDIKLDWTFKLSLMTDLVNMRDLTHENVNAFIGICVDDRGPCVLSTYCSKGSLLDIIENDDIKLDWTFKLSLMTDLVNGIMYINQSPLRIHGNLKSSNCVVDNRWVLKLTDFGLNFRRTGYRKRFLSEYQLYSGLFWTAPENLQADNTCHSCKGDVYSFAIILFEMLYRTQPYETSHTTPKEVINRLLRREKPCFRPTVSHGIKEDEDKVSLGIPRWAFVLMQSSWQQDPNLRPSPSEIKAIIIRGGGGKRLNIMDNMISMLEKYANNLEDIVEQRTGQLLEEKKKTDLLLYRMLPTTVADRLKRGDMVEAEIFGSVTIYFSDIVGFTDMSSSSTPIEIVAFLNDLYTLFDSIIGRFDVYKVETIGDAYMVVSGLPVRNGDNHVTEIAKMSLKLLESMDNFTIRHKPGMKLRIRIGLHTGSCAAGVVGLTMPRYCLFGDTVNMASRMESNGQALRIHISQSTQEMLANTGSFNITLRGEMEIKGKGSQLTYWLDGYKTQELPKPSNNQINEA